MPGRSVTWLLVVADHAVLAVHRNAGKVAHMLVGAGQLVEQRGFAAVLIAGQGKGQRCTGGNGGRRLCARGSWRLCPARQRWGGLPPCGALRWGPARSVACTLSISIFCASARRRVQLITTQLHFNGVPQWGTVLRSVTSCRGSAPYPAGGGAARPHRLPRG